MPQGLKRYQQGGELHFITFSCYRRQPLLLSGRKTHIRANLERVRRWYGLFVTGCAIIPKHTL